MNTTMLRNSVEKLRKLRAELHGSVENSVIEALDEAIDNLEALQLQSGEISARDVLYTLGSVLETLPMIIELIKLISHIIK